MRSKISWRIGSIFLSILIVLSMIFGALLYLSDWGRDWGKLFPGLSSSRDLAGGMIVGETEGKIAILSDVISTEEYEDYGVPEGAEMAYTVTATVSPSNDATNTGVTWSAAWADASSAWASGKALSDYVTLSFGDGYMTSKTAVIACLQAFGEPVIVHISCLDAPEVASSFQIDYAMIPTGISLSFGDVKCNIGGYTPVVVEVNYWADASSINGGMPDLEIFSDGVYTLAPEFTVEYRLSASHPFLPYTISDMGMKYRHVLSFGYTEGILDGQIYRLL